MAGVSGTSVGGQTQPVVINAAGKLGTAPARSASTASLAATVEQLASQVERQRSENARQQRQIDHLREQLKRRLEGRLRFQTILIASVPTPRDEIAGRWRLAS